MTAIRAVVIGLVVAAAGTYPWAWLAAANLKHGPSVPWGPLIMAGYLSLYWYVMTGRGWPRAGAAARRANSRTNGISESAWGAAILAGVLGLWACVVLLRLISRLIPTASESSPGDLTAIPPVTLFSMALMGALVAGVVEEIAFRGYMQRPLERRHGPVIAIVVVGVLFGLAHASHTFWSLAMLPYYMAVAAVYGTLAYLTDSVLPSLVLHATGDALDALLAVGSASGVSATASAQAAPNTPFLLNVVVLAAVSAAAVWGFWNLAETVKRGA